LLLQGSEQIGQQNVPPQSGSPLRESFSGRKFENEVNKLGEIPIRRMLEMSDDVDASVSQVAYLNKQIAERWPVGGDMPSNREARAVRSQPE